MGPALLIVGSLMVANVAKIPWDRIGQAIPAFITLALMPLTYSIAYGAAPSQHLQRPACVSSHVLQIRVVSWRFRLRCARTSRHTCTTCRACPSNVEQRALLATSCPCACHVMVTRHGDMS